MSPTTAPERSASQQHGPTPASGAVARPWLTVMLRELAVKSRDRSVLISTSITLVLIIGGLVASSLLSQRSGGTEYRIAAVGDGAAAVVEASQRALGGDGTVEARQTDRDDAE